MSVFLQRARQGWAPRRSVFRTVAAAPGGGGGEALSIGGTPVTAARRDVAYAGFSATATGGTAPYSYTVASGSLPPGLSLNGSTGDVAGTPLVDGSRAGIVIRATDAASDTADLGPFDIDVDYIGPLAINTNVPNALLASATAYMQRTVHKAMTDISQLRLVFPGWYFSIANGICAQEVAVPDYNIEAWVQYPVDPTGAGATRVLFGGANTGVVPSGTNLRSDLLSINIPEGDAFAVWIRPNGTAGQLPVGGWASGVNTTLHTDEAFRASATVPASPATFSDDSSRRRRGALISIEGPRTGISVAAVGDSKCTFGGSATAENAQSTHLHGDVERSIGLTYAVVNLGAGGDAPSSYIFKSPNRKELALTASHIAFQMGVNEGVNHGGSSTHALLYKARVKPLFNNRRFLFATIGPRTTGTYTSAAGQTVASFQTMLDTWNSAVRADAQYLDFEAATADAGAPGKWRSDGGTARTTDGLHNNDTALADIAANAATHAAMVAAAPLLSGETQPGCDLTLNNGAFATGMFGQGLSGATTWATVGGIVPVVTNVTLECWWKGTSANADILYSGIGRIQVNASGFAQLRRADGTVNASTTTINDNVWRHLALVIADTGYVLYVDGAVAVSTSSVSAIGNGSITNLGMLFNGTNKGANGTIDEVAVWNSAKYTGAFTPPASPYVGDEADLVAVWHCDGSGAGVLGPALTAA